MAGEKILTLVLANLGLMAVCTCKPELVSLFFGRPTIGFQSSEQGCKVAWKSRWAWKTMGVFNYHTMSWHDVMRINIVILKAEEFVERSKIEVLDPSTRCKGGLSNNSENSVYMVLWHTARCRWDFPIQRPIKTKISAAYYNAYLHPNTTAYCIETTCGSLQDVERSMDWTNTPHT